MLQFRLSPPEACFNDQAVTGEDHLYCPLRVDGSDHIHLCKRANIVPSRGFIQRTVLRGLDGSTDMNICITPRPPPHVLFHGGSESIRRTTSQKTEEPARSTFLRHSNSFKPLKDVLFSYRLYRYRRCHAPCWTGSGSCLDCH